MKLVKSLQFKYLLIIFIAVLLIPFSMPIISTIVTLPLMAINDQKKSEAYDGFINLEKEWHSEAKKLQGASDEQIKQRLATLHNKYEDSHIFWVDKTGKTRDKFSYENKLPEQWTASFTVRYMKEHYDSDPFTVVAFLGNNLSDGFMVIEVKRSIVEPPIQKHMSRFGYVYFYVLILFLLVFILISWLFFRKIHKRLLRLSNAMQNKGELGIPQTITISKMDEIGQLEDSFNQMITELEQSRLREQKEETLRKDLIANLSHDLRTPLTAIRAQLSLLKGEVITAKGSNALASIDEKIDYVSKLIDNLFSYTLLSAKKYPFHPVKTEMTRFLRKIAASWYPVFEEKGIEIDIDIQTEAISWEIDPQWMERIIENLLQNVLRHASDGKYIGFFLKDGQLLIKDNGTGFQEKSEHQGAGIGLTIVNVMINEMGLHWKIDSTSDGTTISIYSPLS